MNAIKPCPFCGATQSAVCSTENGPDHNTFFVACGNPECKATGPKVELVFPNAKNYTAFDEAVDAWNKRAD